MNIAEDKIQELKQLDILPIAQHYLDLKREGSAWKCCSPFSQEKTPSFTVISNSKDNFFKCFSTGKSGDVIEFVKEINNTDFIGACKILAELTGIDLEMKAFTPNTGTTQKKPIVKKSLVSNQKPKVIQSYQKPKTIQQELSNEVLGVFEERCISEAIVKAFKVSQSISYFGQLGKKELSIDFNY